MKRKTVKMWLACGSLAMLLLTAICCAAVFGARQSGKAPSRAAAAMPPVSEQAAPRNTAVCGVCGNNAYRIDTLSELAYVLSHDGNVSGGGGDNN